MNRIIAVVAAVLILGGCSSNDPAPAAAPTVAATAPTEGCTATATEELFVLKMSECTARATRVYEFADTAARDNWRKAAESIGTVVVGTGDTWLEVKA
jgi:hypothetical protein